MDSKDGRKTEEANHGRSKGSNRYRRQADRTSKANWASANADLLLSAVCKVTAQGGALRFGYTSDGGAYAIGIYGDGSPYTEYLKPGEDIDQFLQELIEAFSE